MKLSVAWIFDHIKDISLKSVNIPDLVKQFGYKSAEIEGLFKIKTYLDNFTLVKIVDISKEKENIKAYSPELNLDITLPARSDTNLNNIYLNNIYLVKKSLTKKDSNFEWAALEDLGSSKEGLLTNLFIDKDLLSGSWKKDFEQEDYILSIDNIAVSNRPDMWGHRGIAREFAALLDAELVPESEIFQDYKAVNNQDTFSVKITDRDQDINKACKRFAGLYIEQIINRASDLKIATRLARIDSRPINLVVDTTNYVMFDISQPMHAFDADAIKTKEVVTRYADSGEKIKLLDKSEVALTSCDYVITDGGKRPIALAGIMGGLDSGVNIKTDSIFLESANFNSDMIRKTSARVKKRTEASARFEKSLDPNQNTDAILRFLKLITKLKVKYKATESIISLGELAKEKIIKISYNKIIELIGLNKLDKSVISTEKIKSILKKLGFKVELKQDISKNKNNKSSEDIFIITVPTFRSTKDVTIDQDIVEEIARFIGYSVIPLEPPVRPMRSFDTSYVMSLRDIKKHAAFAMKMREVQNYAFFDEEFLKLIHYDPKDAIEITNPHSENVKRLVTSLVPNLIKNISINLNKESKLQFFENNRVWFTDKSNKSQTTGVETVELAGLFFDSKNKLDFYEYKSRLSSLFDLLKIKVSWQKPKRNSVIAPWYDINQFAELVYNNNKISRVIGRAGKVDQKFMNYISEGDAFIFELDSNFLINFKPEVKKFEPLSKYQEVYLDISIFVPLEISSDQIIQTIKSSDKKIETVNLIDFYQKDEWGSKKALTFRFKIVDKSKTLSKEEIDSVWNEVVKSVQNLGALVR